MNAIKKLFSISFISSILFLIFGLLLLFKPEGTINLISSVIGCILLIMGLFSVVKYLKKNNEVSNFELVYGIVSVVAGIVLLVNPGAVVSILPFILGVYFIINGVVKIRSVLDIKRRNGILPTFTLVVAILIVLCGVIFVFNPFGGAMAITKVVGLFLSIYAILDIVNYFMLRKDIKEIENVIIIKDDSE